MARCEDFPCCGHEPGCCPDYDDAGRQMNMRCTCGAVLPVDNPVSICNACLNMGSDDPWDSPDYGREPDPFDDWYEDEFFEDEDDSWISEDV